MTIHNLQEKIAPVLKSYNIRKASVFGSVARGNDTDQSDIDMLVDFNKPIGRIKYGQFLNALEVATGKPVDVISEKYINKHLYEKIKGDIKTIYEG